MGYRSDVRIRLLLEDYEKLKKEYVEKFIDTHVTTWNMFSQENLDIFKLQNTEDYTYDTPENIDELNPSGKCVYFGWNSLKWYTQCCDYEDITFIEGFVNSCIMHSFFRLGEEMDDIECYCEWFYNIGWDVKILDDDDDYN